MLFLQKPRYYDAPDGHAPVDKLIATLKKATVMGLGASLIDCVYFTNTTTALETINCIGFWVVPMAGISVTGVGVTYAATKIRGKDDPLNYGLGGLACFPILHAWSKSTAFAWWVTAGLVVGGMIAKTKHTNNWVFMPEYERKRAYFARDFSLTKEYDKDFRSPYYKTLF